MIHLSDRLVMSHENWSYLPGGTSEAAWLARRTLKVGLGTGILTEVLNIAQQLKRINAIYRCSSQILLELPKAGYWYACLAGLAGKTLGNIKVGPKSYGLKPSVKGMVDGFREGRIYSPQEREAFSAWINDELDRLYSDTSRDPERALGIVNMIAGGRVLCQSQNIGGNNAVILFKTELIGALNELDILVQVESDSRTEWVTYAPEHNLEHQTYFRIPGKVIIQIVPGGDKPDFAVYPDSGVLSGPQRRPCLPQHAFDGVLAVGEIKGRIDTANAWESWMPQVATHMWQWSNEYPNAARLFFGTLLSPDMVGYQGSSYRETLWTIYNRNHDSGRVLTAAFNLTKIAERDSEAVKHFNKLISELVS